jgi:PhoH-like ATPase
LDPRRRDNEIIGKALDLRAKGDDSVVLITDDSNLKLRAFAAGVRVHSYEADWAGKVQGDAGLVKDWLVSEELMQAFLQNGELPIPDDCPYFPNEFIRLSSPTIVGSDETVVRYRYNREKPEASRLRKLPTFVATVERPIVPRNLGQRMALDVGYDDTVDLVILDSTLGTGKTLLTIAVGESTGGRIYITRPTVHVGGQSPGALPGGIDEKNEEWERSFLDNHNVFIGEKAKVGKKSTPLDKEALPAQYKFVPYEFMRGRSLQKGVYGIDEAQNTDVAGTKMIVGRAGNGVKVLLVGDRMQTDVPTLSATNNGLSVAVRALTDRSMTLEEHSRVAVVCLTKVERSPIAELAEKMLGPLSR